VIEKIIIILFYWHQIRSHFILKVSVTMYKAFIKLNVNIYIIYC